MSGVLLGLLIVFLSEGLKYNNDLLMGIVPTALRPELTMKTLLSNVTMVDSIFQYFFNLGIAWLILKFLMKGFNIYIANIEGDPDNDPMGLLTGFIYAVVLSVNFPIVYNFGVELLNESLEYLLTIMTGANESEMIAISAIASAGLFPAVLGVIFLIMFFYLYVKFLKTGLELLIMRIGFPIACGGLMDSDKGMLRPYIQVFYQSMWGLLIRLLLCKFAIALAINGHLLWSIASLGTAIGLPKFLSQFITSVGGNGGINTAYSATRMGQMGYQAFKSYKLGGIK